MRRKSCPHCNPATKRDPWKASQCILNKPLMMVIPPEGVHLDCPVHQKGHHIFGPRATFCEDNSKMWTARRTDYQVTWPENVRIARCSS